MTLSWTGKPSTAQKTAASIRSRKAKRALPRTDDPHGIPTAVMRQLQAEGISDKVIFNRRLQELLAAHKQGGQHG
jgi:hypothetical protein